MEYIFFIYQRWIQKVKFINSDSNNLTSNNIIDNLYTNAFKYRLGDVYQGSYINPKKKYSVAYHLTEFPNSIAAEYMRKNITHTKKNKKLLKKIVNKRAENNSNAQIFSNKELVLHMRIGDVLAKDFNNKHRYIKNNIWWENLIKYIKNNNITTIYIIAGSHLPKNHYNIDLEESKDALFNKINFLKNQGLKVLVRLGNHPDDDIVFAHTAKYFASTGGGFGAILLKDLIIDNGGKVFWTHESGYPRVKEY